MADLRWKCSQHEVACLQQVAIRGGDVDLQIRDAIPIIIRLNDPIIARRVHRPQLPGYHAEARRADEAEGVVSIRPD